MTYEPYNVRYDSYIKLGNGCINLLMIQNVIYVVLVNIYFVFCSNWLTIVTLSRFFCSILQSHVLFMYLLLELARVLGLNIHIYMLKYFYLLRLAIKNTGHCANVYSAPYSAEVAEVLLAHELTGNVQVD